MKNLRVSSKLILSFAFVIVLAVIVGVIGIVGMYMMNVADTALYNENYMPTVTANNISQLVVEQRVAMRNFIIYDVTEDADYFKSAESSLNDSKVKMEQYLAEYDKAISSADDRAAYEEFKKLYEGDWMKLLDEIHTLGVSNDSAAAKMAIIEHADTANRLNELTTTLSDLNLKEGKNAVDSNSSLFVTMTTVSVTMLVIAVAAAIFLAFYISGLISKPLLKMKALMDQIGNTGSLEISGETRKDLERISHGKDEIAQSIASSSKMIQHFEVASGVLQQVAAGDLTARITLLSDKDTIGVSIQHMVDNLNDMFGEINASTSQVATGSKQIADGAQSLAQGSTEQAAAVQQLSSSISEIAEKTRGSANMAGRASDLGNTIKSNAEKGSRQMDQMMQAVKEINDASQNISKVIKAIDDIAFQTNILALNAAVEAARAGQHGKGFAVVAEEVRNLAAKSSDAAKDTGSLIANSIEKAEFGARIADDTAASLAEIVSGINESSAIVGDIARSSEEQAEAITQINKGIDQVAQVVQQNSATAQESAAASQQMSGQSDMLQQLISQFKLRDGQTRISAPRSQKRINPPSYAPSGNSGDEFGKY